MCFGGMSLHEYVLIKPHFGNEKFIKERKFEKNSNEKRKSNLF